MFGLGHVEIHRTSEDSFAGPQLLLGLNHIGAQTTSAFPFCSLIDGGMMERIDQTKTAGSCCCPLSSVLQDLEVELDSALKLWHTLPFPGAVCSIRAENKHRTCDENSQAESRSADAYIISRSSLQEGEPEPPNGSDGECLPNRLKLEQLSWDRRRWEL
ncbi:uncharacterized [Tachysurus ichikawai]